MARNGYTCPVCGKTLTIAGPRNIELHEKSKFHIAAMKQGIKKEIVTGGTPESGPPENEPINEIKTTAPEVKNDKKEIGKRDSGDNGDNGDSGAWDGYLC